MKQLSNFPLVFANLAAVHQNMIKEDTGHHRFANGDSADADTWVMATFGDDIGFLA